MTEKIKYGKITAVVFLTVLIWVWADLALDEEFPAPAVVVSVAESANPKLWVCFNDETSGPVRKIVLREVLLKGPASRIAKLERRLKEGEKLEISFDAVREKMETPNNYKLDLLPFLQKDKRIRQLGLTVVSCTPTEIPVTVVGLSEKLLDVVCLDEKRNPVKTTAVEPAQVRMLVTPDWNGPAEVKLTQDEIKQARLAPLEKTPYVLSPAGQIEYAVTTVTVKTTPEQSLLSEFPIKVKLKFSLSPNLQGKYRVEVENLSAVMSPVTILATLDAKNAYENMSYQVRLEIDDEDASSEMPVRGKNLEYNFPQDYLRSNQIELKGQPVEARFKLIPLTLAQ